MPTTRSNNIRHNNRTYIGAWDSPDHKNVERCIFVPQIEIISDSVYCSGGCEAFDILEMHCIAFDVTLKETKIPSEYIELFNDKAIPCKSCISYIKYMRQEGVLILPEES